MYPCGQCANVYTRKYNLDRHKAVAHQSELPKQIGGMKFLHPFTMMVAGMTGCGKTTLTPGILSSIEPPPEKLIYCYRHWQPMYDSLKRAIPNIIFIQGLPDGLSDDQYFDKSCRNVIVLDDLMSTSCKDKRVTSLFTDGSHHRNLSVITLSQNMYYSKDPTQRRNCQYIILFKNPVDMQSVMTFARQMYPSKPHILMDVYNEAVAKPYGYLVVDNKANTKEEDRLRANCINPGNPPDLPQAKQACSGNDQSWICLPDDSTDSESDIIVPDTSVYKVTHKPKAVSCKKTTMDVIQEIEFLNKLGIGKIILDKYDKSEGEDALKKLIKEVYTEWFIALKELMDKSYLFSEIDNDVDPCAKGDELSVCVDKAVRDRGFLFKKLARTLYSNWESDTDEYSDEDMPSD